MEPAYGDPQPRNQLGLSTEKFNCENKYVMTEGKKRKRKTKHDSRTESGHVI